MARIATSSIHDCGQRIPRRRRQSGSALRKLIKSVAAAGLSSGETKRLGRVLNINPELNAAFQGYWNTLQIGPGNRPAKDWNTMRDHLRSQGDASLLGSRDTLREAFQLG